MKTGPFRFLLTLGLVAAAYEWLGASEVAIAMATTLVTDTAMQNTLKIIFDDVVVDNVVTDSELADLMSEGSGIQQDQTTGGRYIETAQMFALPSGFGFRAEDGYIPVPGGPNVQNSRVYLKKAMGSVEMSGDTMKQVRTSEGAFMNYAERVLPGLRTRITNEVDRVMLGYGAGIKARVNDATPSNPLAVDSAFGVTGWGGAVFQFLEGETLIASPNADGTSPRATIYTVESIDYANDAINLDAVTNLVDNDYLFLGDAADNSADKEAMGLAGIVDDGTILNVFQNINRTTYPRWKAYVMDAQADGGFTAGQTLTEDVIHYADDTAFQRGGAKVDTLVTSREGFRLVYKDLRLDRSINDPRAYTGGPGKGVSIVLAGRELNLRVARKCPPTLCYGLTKSSLKRWFLHEWEWNTMTGALWRQVTDATGRKDAFYAYGSMYYEMGSSDPQKNFRIENFALS